MALALVPKVDGREALEAIVGPLSVYQDSCAERPAGYGANLHPATVYPRQPRGVPFSGGWIITSSGRHVATVRQVSMAPPDAPPAVRSFYPVYMKVLAA